MEEVKTFLKNWKYKNLTFLLISLVALFFLAGTSYASDFIRYIGNLGYIGAVLTGIFFVSTYTVAPASVVLFHLARELNPILIAICGGIGAMIGDYLVFRYFKDHVFEELKMMFSGFHQTFLEKILNSPFFAWITPVVGAILIASPFPDEIGIMMMGFSKIRKLHFFVITFLLNSLGILLVITIANSI